VRKLQIISFLKPSVRKLILFGILSFICIGGVIQTYAFINEGTGIPKPPLYDVLRPLELWTPWIIFALPVHFVGKLLDIEWLIEYFPDIGATFRLPTASLIYAYIVSCWTIHVWDKWLTRKSRKIAVLIGITPVIFLYLPIVLFQPSIFLGHLTKIISGFSFLFLVLITYIVSIYGLYRLMKT